MNSFPPRPPQAGPVAYCPCCVSRLRGYPTSRRCSACNSTPRERAFRLHLLRDGTLFDGRDKEVLALRTSTRLDGLLARAPFLYVTAHSPGEIAPLAASRFDEILLDLPSAQVESLRLTELGSALRPGGVLTAVVPSSSDILHRIIEVSHGDLQLENASESLVGAREQMGLDPQDEAQRLRRADPEAPHLQNGWLAGEGESSLVSVVTPVYNRADLLPQTIDSVLGQTHRQVEHLIVDDGSEEDIGAVVEAVRARLGNDDRLHYLRQPHAGGQRARNRGMLNARGEFLQFLDSDDLLHPDKIAHQVAALHSRPDADFAVGQRLHFRDGQPQPDPSPFLPLKEPVTLAQVQGKARIQTAAPLFRRRALRRIGPWNETLCCGQEGEYFARALILGLRAVLTPTAVCYVRVHEKNMSHTLQQKKHLAGMVRSREIVVRTAEAHGVACTLMRYLALFRNRAQYRASLGDWLGALDDLASQADFLRERSWRESVTYRLQLIGLTYFGCQSYLGISRIMRKVLRT